MKRLFYTVIAVVLVSLPGQTVFAGGPAVTVKMGTLGYGADLTVGLVPTVNLRLGVNTISLDIDVAEEDSESGGEEIQTEIEWLTLAVLLDWHLTEGGFRVTGGIMINNNEVNLSADISESVEINDRAYIVSDFSGNISFNDIAPYLGIGYGNAVGEGRWHFALDLGVMFQGAPDVTIEARSSNPIIQAILDRDLQAEAQELEDDTEMFDMYPVLSLGASFAF